jgi:hypothetical protein
LGYNFIFILVSILVFSALLPLSKIKYSWNKLQSNLFCCWLEDGDCWL